MAHRECKSCWEWMRLQHHTRISAIWVCDNPECEECGILVEVLE
jgi:hypothetical protein